MKRPLYETSPWFIDRHIRDRAKAIFEDAEARTGLPDGADDVAVWIAQRVAMMQPQGNASIDKLPPAPGLLLATDEFAIFRAGNVPYGGRTYKGLLGQLLQNQVLPYFYVGAYGAIGDGTTDDSGAINAALAAAANNGPQGGTVLLGPFRYAVASMIFNNSSNVNILGMGEGTSVLIQKFSPSVVNPAILMNGPNAVSCTYSQFTLAGPGNTATGSTPGPSTPANPQLGTGWGFLNNGGSQCKMSYVNTAGCFHGFGAIMFGTTGFNNCTAGMGGIQQQTQYGFYAQGPEGSAATGTITISLSPAPQAGDTITGVFNDGQGNIITVPAYTVTAADAGAPTPANAVAVSLANWFNNSDIVIGFFANWNACVASGNTVVLSIDVPSSATTPTYSVSSTGTTVVAPTATTAVTGGTRLKNPVSQVFAIISCQVPQAQYHSGGQSYASTEGIHIDGAVTSVSIQDFGTTGVQYGVRLANVNSGSDSNPKFISISHASFDHSHFCSISHESGSLVKISNVQVIANFGAGPPPTSFAINIAPTAGGAEITDCEIGQCDSGGIGIGNGPVIISNCHIQQVGRRHLSAINFIGSNAIIGVTIKNCKLGAPNLAANQNDSASYGIDFAGPGSPTQFTGTLQSLTIQNNDIYGASGQINGLSVLANSLSTFLLSTYITIKDNPGLNPLYQINQPGQIMFSPYSQINPFFSDALVTITPNGATITSIEVAAGNNNQGNVQIVYNASTGFGAITTPVTIPVTANGSLGFIWTGSGPPKVLWSPL